MESLREELSSFILRTFNLSNIKPSTAVYGFIEASKTYPSELATLKLSKRAAIGLDNDFFVANLPAIEDNNPILTNHAQ